MHIRLICPRDFSATASVAVSSFSDEETLSWVHCYKDQYPEAFHQFFLRKLRSRFWAVGCYIYVAVLDKGDRDYQYEEQAVGYAVWERQGESDMARRWRQPSLRRRKASSNCHAVLRHNTDSNNLVATVLESALLRLEEDYYALIHADKSMDYDRLRQYVKIEQFDNIPEIWRIRGLCVDPAFQGRGIAGKLLDWGQEQASREACPIGLMSSQMAEAVYLKKGFREYGRVLIGGLIDAPAMIWEPKGLEGKWGVKKTAEVAKEPGT